MHCSQNAQCLQRFHKVIIVSATIKLSDGGPASHLPDAAARPYTGCRVRLISDFIQKIGFSAVRLSQSQFAVARGVLPAFVGIHTRTPFREKSR
jgi:hypothetical protein